MHHLSDFIIHFGYWAVAVGCLLEGETVLLLAGLSARQGYLSLPWVMATGAAAGCLGDVLLFSLGRWHGPQVLARWPRLAGPHARVEAALARWGTWLVVGIRFMYGLRLAGPILLGTSRFPWGRFVAFNALGAALWAALVAGMGWLFGHAAQLVLKDVEHAEHWALLALLLVALGWGGWRLWRRRRPPVGAPPQR